ncbi:MAG: crossover junction endodeoxyribonuclease RuvC [Myxococcales bacterium]|nr:crossover junction endodeoxyribonuclease RuvC [Myxococcales bacterium]
MRVIGIDPGTHRLGWGVVDRSGSRLSCVAWGVITAGDGELADRLVVIDRELGVVIAAHAPDVSAVEGIFFAKDAQSACKLGHARGVALLRLRSAGMAVHEYAPARVKRTVVGSGRADKLQVALLVANLLRLPDPPPSDAADALAIAVTHLASAGFEEALARASRRG